jgi:hypothetical protein
MGATGRRGGGDSGMVVLGACYMSGWRTALSALCAYSQYISRRWARGLCPSGMASDFLSYLILPSMHANRNFRHAHVELHAARADRIMSSAKLHRA